MFDELSSELPPLLGRQEESQTVTLRVAWRTWHSLRLFTDGQGLGIPLNDHFIQRICALDAYSRPLRRDAMRRRA